MWGTLAAGRVVGRAMWGEAQGRLEEGRQAEEGGGVTAGVRLERETRGEAMEEEEDAPQPQWWVLGGCSWRGCRDSKSC